MTQITLTRTPLPADQPVQGWIGEVLGNKPHVFACLDANRIPNLPELLDSGGVPHQCLFQGALAESAGDLAPWLVQLGPNDRLLAQLMTSHGADASNPFGFLEAEAGIFIHSDMSIGHLHRHLRRFLRVRSPDDRTFLFRFWEPAIAVAYFGGLDQRPALIDRWFRSREGGTISQIAITDPVPGAPGLRVFAPHGIDPAAPPPSGAFMLNDEDLLRFRVVQMDKDAAQIAVRLTQTFPEAAAAVPGGSMDAFTRRSMSRMLQYGFQKKSALFTMLAWELHYGPFFEKSDSDGTLYALISGAAPQNEKFENLKQRMVALGR